METIIPSDMLTTLGLHRIRRCISGNTRKPATVERMPFCMERACPLTFKEPSSLTSIGGQALQGTYLAFINFNNTARLKALGPCTDFGLDTCYNEYQRYKAGTNACDSSHCS